MSFGQKSFDRKAFSRLGVFKHSNDSDIWSFCLQPLWFKKSLVVPSQCLSTKILLPKCFLTKRQLQLISLKFDQRKWTVINYVFQFNNMGQDRIQKYKFKIKEFFSARFQNFSFLKNLKIPF
jgi:hypothetical protein